MPEKPQLLASWLETKEISSKLLRLSHHRWCYHPNVQGKIQQSCSNSQGLFTKFSKAMGKRRVYHLFCRGGAGRTKMEPRTGWATRKGTRRTFRQVGTFQAKGKQTRIREYFQRGPEIRAPENCALFCWVHPVWKRSNLATPKSVEFPMTPTQTAFAIPHDPVPNAKRP